MNSLKKNQITGIAEIVIGFLLLFLKGKVISILLTVLGILVLVSAFRDWRSQKTNAAIAKLSEGAEVIELQPQDQQVRKLQHELVEAHGFKSVSVGEGQNRHLKIFKDE